jgi:type IV secretory pathway VirD2 relaxase
VHLSVRAESKHGQRLSPRKADLHRWRETFADKLRGLGVEAEATPQATRGVNRSYEPIWRIKAREAGRLRSGLSRTHSGPRTRASRAQAMEAWGQVGRALAQSGDPADRELARSIGVFVREAVSRSTTAREGRVVQFTALEKLPDIDRGC